jgi:hypothetical protein
MSLVTLPLLLLLLRDGVEAVAHVRVDADAPHVSCIDNGNYPAER